MVNGRHIGPVVVNYIREAQLAAGVPRDHLYDYTLYILAGMLVVGLICNLLIKPVDPKWYMSADEIAKAVSFLASDEAVIFPGSNSSSMAACPRSDGHEIAP